MTIEGRKPKPWTLRRRVGDEVPVVQPLAGPGLDETQPMGEAAQPEPPADVEDDTLAGARLPRIEQMPEGIVVEERMVGRAMAQWIVQIRCECGRRWFEVEAVPTATCPRCGMTLIVEVEGGPRRG